MGWRVIVVVVVVLVAVGAGVSGATEPGGAERTDWSPHESTAAAEQSTTDTGFDRSEFRIHVHADGNATWTFTYERPIENDDEREEFEAFAEEFRTEETDLYADFQDQAHALAGAGENVTDREMQATDFSRDAAVQQPVVGDIGTDVGVVELSFVWTNFADEDDGTLYLGDVFDRGLSLTDGQSLVIETGDGVRFESVAPDDGATSDTTLSDSRSVTWTGDREFPDGHPRAALVPEDDDAGSLDGDSDGSPADEDESSPTDGTAGEDGTLPVSPWVALLGIAAIALAALAVAVRRDVVSLPIGDGATEASETSEGDRSTAAAPDTSGGDGLATEATGDDDSELLSDEEQIRQMLETNDGRMKQSAIVEATDWSKSKVSMLLSEMESEGVVSKISVGRENIITLAGDEPDAARSPFDDDT